MTLICSSVRAENTLGFTCRKAFRRCGGDPEEDQSNSKLKELGNCMQCSCPPSKCSYQDIESNSGLVGAWDNKGIKKCQSGRGNVCSCETGFKVCDIQTDEREVGSKCRACVKATYKETLKKAECLDKKIINRPKSANTESEETENNEATENWNPLIIGGSVAGIVILVLVIVLVLVLTRRRKRASSANQREEKDENPIYGPRDTIYLDEVDRYTFGVALITFTVVNFTFTYDHFITRLLTETTKTTAFTKLEQQGQLTTTRCMGKTKICHYHLSEICCCLNLYLTFSQKDLVIADI